MTGSGLPEPDARLRAHCGPHPDVKLHVRSATLRGLGRASWNAAATHPSALDYLLAALATDLVSGIGEEARRAGQVLEDVELRLEAFLESPLVVAGVIGEEGSPRVASIRGALYVRSACSEDDVRSTWERARASSPVLASLAPTLTIDIELKPVF
jgi:OsmC-like protein